MVEATSEKPKVNGRHADGTDADRKSHPRILNPDHDHKDDVVVQQVTEVLGPEDVLDTEDVVGEKTTKDENILSDKSASANEGATLENDVLENRSDSASERTILQEKNDSSTSTPSSKEDEVLNGKPEAADAHHHDVGHKEATIHPHDVRLGGPSFHSDNVGSGELSIGDHSVRHTQEHGNDVDRDDLGSSLIIVDWFCNMADPLFRFPISRFEPMSMTRGLGRPCIKTPAISSVLEDETCTEHLESIMTEDSLPPTTAGQTTQILLQASDNQSAIEDTYEILAGLRPEAEESFMQQSVYSLWDFVNSRPHPLENYRPSHSLTALGAMDTFQSLLSLEGSQTFSPKDVFTYCLCRKLGLLRPATLEPASPLGVLVPCGMYWNLPYNDATRLQLKSQVFESIWTRLFAIEVVRCSLRSFYKSDFFHGTMIPTPYVRTLNNYLAVNYNYLLRCADFDPHPFFQTVSNFLKSDPAKAKPSESGKLSGEIELLLRFMVRMKSDHRLTFNIPSLQPILNGDLIIATANVLLFIAVEGASPYGACHFPYRLKRKSRFLSIVTLKAGIIEFDKDGNQTLRDKVAHRGKNLKWRAKIKEHRRNFQKYNFPHRVKDEKLKVAVDDPNHWALTTPWEHRPRVWNRVIPPRAQPYYTHEHIH
ncbi:uncharacterized protein LY89DRAFT_731283 [Mollisia scopiformis]|uniref:Uncharacterized protein n=1 Tax=Mollisia scopiformis TaxID=149040 RepID=A0A194XIV5_MOLSC|nr:uncharacterized protein LY89DRAFT_731283 [Mollisia scopiformis]KUJ20044.1 hypothetical protein LY89DRAFT_731283 [Mollisia scopiformis]